MGDVDSTEISDAELDELEHAWAPVGGETVINEQRDILRLIAALRSAREQRQLAEDRLRSVCAWAKNARHPKVSGLPPSRALRWIDELGDRLFAHPTTEEPTDV